MGDGEEMLSLLDGDEFRGHLASGSGSQYTASQWPSGSYCCRTTAHLKNTSNQMFDFVLDSDLSGYPVL